MVLSFSGAAFAADSVAELTALLQSYDTFAADFDQITVAESGRSAQQTKGHISLAKPNLFRWQTIEPAPQEIVSDGRYLWIYDPDLEQVTRKTVNLQNNSAPAQILNGQVDQLLQEYQLEHPQGSGNDQLFVLTAREAQASFSIIRLVFHQDVLSELMLEDTLGQRTTIVFKGARRNPDLAEEVFAFRVPKGVDLIIDGAE
ncbi:outer membrane lipoprotein chaperone LolA [Pontibacter sp. JAM-7]|uniref:outer membrane lipoprotein chaperone LolA n=1 Tax=Pontibacter sp. JAM-7 TaxID=3366581 RepID=UPI003AF53310